MKRNTIIILVLVIVGVLLITYFFLNKTDKKHFSWQENYDAGSEGPYGTMLIKNLLESYRPGENFIYNSNSSLTDLFNSDSINYPANYVFIGKELLIGQKDTEALLEFISSGNDALIIVPHLPYQVVDTVFHAECGNQLYVKEYTTPSATFNFYNYSLQTPEGYTYTYQPGSQKRDYRWTALQPGVFCDSTTELIALGHFDDDRVNFFRMPIGEGNLYIHTNPIAFTNYFLRMPDKAEYAAAVFSHLEGNTIIWDEYSKSPVTSTDPQSNPLALIMQHDSLKYAWWLMIVSALLYTFFTAKRKQRVVPVREEKTNTSLEYVKMVSALHFENGNNKDIAVKKMKYFQYFIRSKYGIHGADTGNRFIERLAEKSQVDMNHVQSIFFEYQRIERNQFDSAAVHQLMNLYNAIDHFYRHCK